MSVASRQLKQARATASRFCTAAVTITRPADPTFVDGEIVPGNGLVVYTGAASISDRRDSRPAEWGGISLLAGQWPLRAPLS